MVDGWGKSLLRVGRKRGGDFGAKPIAFAPRRRPSKTSFLPILYQLKKIIAKIFRFISA